MDISGRVVTIGMSTDDGLVSRKVFLRKGNAKFLGFFKSQPVLIFITGIKTDDVVMSFYFFFGLVLMLTKWSM